jgi:signal transduction histidine kinase
MKSIDKLDMTLLFIHELRMQINLLNNSASILSKSVEKKIDQQAVVHHANRVTDVIETINTNLTLLNIGLNPEFYTIQVIQPIDIYSIFYRCTKLLRQRLKSKDLKINYINNDNIQTVNSLPITHAIPYIILDNAIKYSIKSSDIDIEFSKIHKNIRISVSSEGPIVTKNELIKLTEIGYRGKYAEEYNPDGKGLGLYYLKQICNLCNINLDISTSTTSYILNDQEWSTFTINLDMPNNMDLI